MWTFKHNVYEGNEILSIKEISSLEKFHEEGITLDVIPSPRFIDETLDIEMVAEAENTTASKLIKGISKSYVYPVAQKFTNHSCIMWNIFQSVTSLFLQVNSANI